jgi:hypothetical protein
MYGPGGTVNESLKDRNQVQLKDKARNLKLFFLKSGIEVPYYLKAVTGDLMSRAPGQALKQEARKKEQLQSEEERTRFDSEQDDVEREIAALEASLAQSEDQSPVEQEYVEPPADTEQKLPFQPSMEDVEAMIARAAAQAAQPVSQSWT